VGIVIDTSALIAVERGPQRARRAKTADRLAPADAMSAWTQVLRAIGDQPAAIPAIVYAELLVGVELADNAKRAAARRARIDALTAHVLLIDFNAEIAQVWARLFATMNRAGRAVPANDLAVAATAIHLEYAVLVGPSDEKHFRAIEGLKVETLRG
jgi:predicted nucleic acid-binding protein